MYSWHIIFNNTYPWVEVMNVAKFCSAFYFAMAVVASLETIVSIHKHGLLFVKMISWKRVLRVMMATTTQRVGALPVPIYPMYSNWRSVCIYLDLPGRDFGIVYEKARATTLTEINMRERFRSWRNLSTLTRWISNVNGTFSKQEKEVAKQ
jgi:hypothetical protein